MAKDYLNRQERETITAGAIAKGNLLEYLEQNHKHLTAAERKNLKLCTTYFDKFLVETFRRVGGKEADKILTLISTERLVFKAKDVIDKTNTITVDVDSFADVAEGLIEGHCKNCAKPKEQVEVCKVREVMTLADVPAVEPYYLCPYRQV